jgi:hypothetical protein
VSKRGPSEAQLWLVDYLRERYPHKTVDAEYRFHGLRKWRFDVAVFGPSGSRKFAIEVEGGIFSGGAHTRGKHFMSDCEKYNTATALGWEIYRFTPEQILKGEAKAFLESYL